MSPARFCPLLGGLAAQDSFLLAGVIALQEGAVVLEEGTIATVFAG